MFDFRYHATSLAAVFLALLVGILLGVAIGDANLVSNAERSLRNTLQVERDAARRDAAQLRAQLLVRTQFESAAYPALVSGRLTGLRIGLVFLGQASDDINQLVRSAVEQSGGQLVVVADIGEPLNLSAIASVSAPYRYTALPTDPTLLRPFGVRIGLQLAQGGRLIQQLGSNLLSAYNGTIEPLNGVVLVRNHAAATPQDQQAIDTFESGLATGLTAASIPVVGVETQSTTPSNIPWYTQANFASVDDLDDIAGQAALALALADGVHGAYGVKSTATAILPPVPGTPTTATTTTGP